MIRRRICYLMLLAAGGYFIMLYNFQGLRFLFCCLLCMPLVSLLFLFPAAFLCRVSLSAGRETVLRGEQPEIFVAVENRGWLPAARMQVELCWEAPGEKAVKIRKWFCGMGRMVRQERIQELGAVHCGCGAMTVKRARLYDYLGIFALPVKTERRVEICIMPIIFPMPREVAETYVRIRQGVGTEREGDLLLRDFQPGDSLHRVYWKLSARGGGLQVRDFERSGSVTVFLHFSDGFRTQAEQWDRYLDMAVSLLDFFAGESGMTIQVSVEVVWRRGTVYLGCAIPDGEALQKWLRAFLTETETGDILSEEEMPLWKSGWHLEEDCRLYYGEQCVYEE